MTLTPCPRATAALVLKLVFTEKLQFNSRHPLIERLKSSSEQAFSRHCCFGVLRNYWQLTTQINPLIKKPFKPKDQDIWALILIGVHLLQESPNKAHSIVNETVKAADTLKKSWAKNLINAVLRQTLRQQEKSNLSLASNPQFTFNHPLWLIRKFKQDWPDQWESICKANDQHPPLSLRVNLQKHSLATYCQKLKEAKLNYKTFAFSKTAVELLEPIAVTDIPGFKAGEVSVQDTAGQFTGELLELKPNLRVLDACAAPGSKTSLILELEPDIHCVAIDLVEARSKKLHENLTRLNLKATTLTADSKHPDLWWDRIPFDRILLDVPCTATGVIRRHPDIKILRTPDCVSKIKNEQFELLEALWPLLKPNGILLFSSCSILPEENELQIENFKNNHSDCEVINLNVSWGEQRSFGTQILPGNPDNMDGFYYAKLKKVVK